MSRRKAMSASADNDKVVAGLRFGISPDRLPPAMTRQGFPDQPETGISHHVLALFDGSSLAADGYKVFLIQPYCSLIASPL
jgi:hypothetical protein